MSFTAYTLSADPARLQFDWICPTLAATYWARGRSRAMFEAAAAASRCYGIYDNQTGAQVAFARVVTDGVTFAWLCDVVVEQSRRGRGLGTWLVRSILADPALGTVTWRLATRDAHGLYEKLGFTRDDCLRRPASARDLPQTP